MVFPPDPPAPIIKSGLSIALPLSYFLLAPYARTILALVGIIFFIVVPNLWPAVIIV